jgi:hypothetical protein
MRLALRNSVGNKSYSVYKYKFRSKLSHSLIALDICRHFMARIIIRVSISWKLGSVKQAITWLESCAVSDAM